MHPKPVNTILTGASVVDATERCDPAVQATYVAKAVRDWLAVQPRESGKTDRAPSLRELAAVGELPRYAACEEVSRIRAEAFSVVLPLVWERHTRPLERHKGHLRCASGVAHLAPECFDGLTDDLESVVAALLAYRRPIENLEGWITSRMANAIKDGHRARRARDMGAQQRVRVPARLQSRLANDPWLVALAGRMLQWAGVRYTAGTQLWPLGAWADDRAALAGPDRAREPSFTVAGDLAIVLRTMREWDASWYEKYVERPLGRKWAPVVADPLQSDDGSAAEETAHLELVPPYERDDAWLAEAAGFSLARIRKGIDAGGEPCQVVGDALTVAFLSDAHLPVEFDRVPLTDDDPGTVVARVLADTEAMKRVVMVALQIIDDTRVVR
jgi:hypothetical protein